MTESEDSTSGTTVAQKKTRTESNKGQKITLPGQEGHGNGLNARNNTRNSAASNNKYYKGEIEAFVAVLALKYEKVELKK